MHVTRVALVLATASAYLAPAVALVIGPSQTSGLDSRDQNYFRDEADCHVGCSYRCEIGFWGEGWQCINDFGLIDPNNGVPKK